VTSLLFGLGHPVNHRPLGALLTQAATAAVLGWMLAGVRLRSGAIWAAVALHGLLDRTARLHALAAPPASAPSARPGWVLIIGLLGVAGLYGRWLIQAYLHQREPRHQQAPTGPPATRDAP
jgi:membrane protease YdiL (CAAX protease family)